MKMTMEKIKEAEALQESYRTPNSDYDRRFSKTSQFMTPAIGVNVTNDYVFKFFENAFLTDVNHEHDYVRPIFLLFKVRDFTDKNWTKVYNTLVSSENYITEYDVGVQDDKFLVMLVFSVPEEFKEDYVNFKLGRYSLFSPKYKEKFPEYIDEDMQKKNIHWQIINKDPELKREIEETFNMSWGEMDRPTVIAEYDKNGNIIKKETFPPASEIWDKPRKEREYYRYVKPPSL